MSQYLHKVVAYGVGAFSFMSLGIAANRDAAALPFASRVHSVPLPAKSHIFDQRTRGGGDFEPGKPCGTHTRLLVRSEQPLETLRKHYAAHRIAAAQGQGSIVGTVEPAAKVTDLVDRWKVHQNDASVYVVDFRSPGYPGTDAACGL